MDFSGILHDLIVGDLALGVAFGIVVLVLGSHGRIVVVSLTLSKNKTDQKSLQKVGYAVSFSTC